MSKRYFGLTKWRLGKAEDDYKKHKEKKKGLKYLEEEKVKVRHKKKYKCKKLKGDHDFKQAEIKKWEFFKETIITYKCIACGKEKIEFKKNE